MPKAKSKGGKSGGGTKMERFSTIRTPKGRAGFSYLVEPDTKYGAKHRVQVFIDKADPEVKTFVGALLTTKAEYFKKIGKTDPEPKKVPHLKKADAYLAEKFGEKFGVKEGDLYFEFNSNARETEDGEGWRPVPIFDVKGKASDTIQVWSGDLIRVQVTLMGYDTGKEKGIKAYLDAVQMLKKMSGGRTIAFADESEVFGGGDAPAAAEAPVVEEADGFADESEPETEPTTEVLKPVKVKKGEAAAPEAKAEGVDLSDLV